MPENVHESTGEASPRLQSDRRYLSVPFSPENYRRLARIAARVGCSAGEVVAQCAIVGAHGVREAAALIRQGYASDSQGNILPLAEALAEEGFGDLPRRLEAEAFELTEAGERQVSAGGGA